MSPRAFVTGIGGFAGGHLAEALLRANTVVDGTIRPGTASSRIVRLPPGVTLHPCDVRSADDLAEAVRKAKPDVVYHLAATTSVSEGETDPVRTMEVNLTGTLHLLEAIRTESPGALLTHISSSEVYGIVESGENPIGEERTRAPVHVYGLSKLLSEELVGYYRRRHGLPAIILRPFNHIGPGQSDRFVCASFAKQLVFIEKGMTTPVLHVGNLDPVRDFTDVRDMVEAYRLAAERCDPGSVLNVASGRGTSIQHLLSELRSLIDVPIEVRQDPDRGRKTEIPVLVGDATSLTARTGWRRRFELRHTLSDTIDYWRRMAEEPST